MKKILQYLFDLPIRLANRIDINGQSLLWGSVNRVFSDRQKLKLARKPQFTRLTNLGNDKSFRLVAYMNAINTGTVLANKFAVNLLDHLQLFESQLGQDCIADTIHNGMENGIFVEIGVGEGRKISNTFFLEKYRNWNGLLCEPSKEFHESISRDRSAKLIPQAVFDKTGLVMSFEQVRGAGELSTLSNFKDRDGHKRSDSVVYEVQTVSFNDLYDNNLAGKRINFLSVDTEGSEWTILSAIDFKRIQIDMIAVEHNYDQKKIRKINDLLTPYEYVEILPGVFEFDSIYIKAHLQKVL